MQVHQPHSQAISKTSNNGHSEKRTTSTADASLAPIDFTVELIHYEPLRSAYLLTPNNNGH